MNLKSRLCLVALFFGTALAAQNAKDIVQKADEKARGKTSVATMTITTIRPKWSRTMVVKVWSKGNDYSLLRIQAPVKEEGTVYLKRKKEVWNWLPTLERTIKLPPSMMSQSWMGTDFTNDDLVKESSIVNDYDHSILGIEHVGDLDCYKIQLLPKAEAAVVWGKIIVWIDRKDFLQLRVEFFDENFDLVNTMVGSEIKAIGGRLLPTKMVMTPTDKPGNQTVIVYESIVFDQPISDSFFATQNMTKVK